MLSVILQTGYENMWFCFMSLFLHLAFLVASALTGMRLTQKLRLGLRGVLLPLDNAASGSCQMQFLASFDEENYK